VGSCEWSSMKDDVWSLVALRDGRQRGWK